MVDVWHRSLLRPLASLRSLVKFEHCPNNQRRAFNPFPPTHLSQTLNSYTRGSPQPFLKRKEARTSLNFPSFFLHKPTAGAKTFKWLFPETLKLRKESVTNSPSRKRFIIANYCAYPQYKNKWKCFRP